MSRLIKSVLLMISFIYLSGCNFQAKDVQLIEINVSNDKEKNDQIAQALMFYSPLYFVSNIPTLTEKNYSGIQVGYVRAKDLSRSNFRVFYVLNNSELTSADIAAIKQEFEIFIPIMAEEHASKYEVFESQSKIKAQWLKVFLNNNGEAKYMNSLSRLVLNEFGQQLQAIPGQVSAQLGKVEQVEYLRPQYYRAFNGFQEQVVLVYEVTFRSGSKSLVQVALDGSNKVIHLEFNQIMT
ncbi:hypothetical protein [Vibrio sp. WXL210]|uniref:hypothetical protein n=1 Tax=Vibrio sp. WXL210 TaxID=3450709 RepID=UPI003EC5BBA1